MTFLTLLSPSPSIGTLAYFKVSGSWQLATVYVKSGGAWIPATSFIKTAGAWS